jgi:hypothetical protein
MDHGRTIKKIFDSKLEGSKRERLRLRKLADVEKDLQEMMIKRWRQKAADREE